MGRWHAFARHRNALVGAASAGHARAVALLLASGEVDRGGAAALAALRGIHTDALVELLRPACPGGVADATYLRDVFRAALGAGRAVMLTFRIDPAQFWEPLATPTAADLLNAADHVLKGIKKYEKFRVILCFLDTEYSPGARIALVAHAPGARALRRAPLLCALANAIKDKVNIFHLFD